MASTKRNSMSGVSGMAQSGSHGVVARRSLIGGGIGGGIGRGLLGRGLLGRVAGTAVSCAAVIGFVAGAAGPATSADAQLGLGMGGGGMGMGARSVSRQSLETYARILGMDEAQKEAAKILADGYRATLADLETDLKGRIVKLEEQAQNEGFGVLQKQMPKMIGEFGERQKAAESQFIKDIKALLTDAQLEKFPKLERHRRRETYMRMGTVSGAGVDVWLIQERLLQREGIVVEENRGQVTEVMDRYDMDMDRLLQEMERLYKEDAGKDAEGGAEMFDFTRTMGRIKPYSDLGFRIRDLNREAARKLEALLTEEGQKQFRVQFKVRAYPRVYRKSVVQKLYDAAMKLPDLTEEQKEAVLASKTRFERDLGPLNEAWARAIDDAEPKAGGSMALLMNQYAGAGSFPELSDARKARQEADRAAKARLVDLLTAEQREQLPSEVSLTEDPMKAMFGGDDEDEE